MAVPSSQWQAGRTIPSVQLVQQESTVIWWTTQLPAALTALPEARPLSLEQVLAYLVDQVQTLTVRIYVQRACQELTAPLGTLACHVLWARLTLIRLLQSALNVLQEWLQASWVPWMSQRVCLACLDRTGSVDRHVCRVL